MANEVSQGTISDQTNLMSTPAVPTGMRPSAPITFTINRLILPPIAGNKTWGKNQGAVSASEIKQTDTRVTFPLPTGRMSVMLERGDVYVLGLKGVKPSLAASGCGCKCACSGDSNVAGESRGLVSMKKEDAGFADVKDDVGVHDPELDAGLAPLGGTYELTLEEDISEAHDLVRVLGAVFRKYDEDKVLLQLLPERMSLCELYLHSHIVNTSTITSKLSKHARHILQRLHKTLTAPKDESGLLVGEDGWARVPDGYALDVSPGVNDVREGGTDVRLELSFRQAREHDVRLAFGVATAISNDEHDWSGSNQKQGLGEISGEEVVSVGCHIVTVA